MDVIGPQSTHVDVSAVLPPIENNPYSDLKMVKVEEYYLETKEVDNSTDIKARAHSDEARKLDWSPSILRIAPLSGIGALLFVFIQIFASYAVLATSHGADVKHWKYQPTVYLAILTAISNKALAFAVVQGTVVTLWLRLLKGTSLGQVHRDWAYGLHVYKAMMAGRRFNMLALACICGTFVAIDGPFLQRASSVRADVPYEPVGLSISIAPEMPAYFSGWLVYIDLPAGEGMAVTSEFLPILNSYTNNEPINAGIAGCSGTCSAVVQAPALAVEDCTYTKTYRNYTAPVSQKDEKLWNEGCYANIHDREVFGASVLAYNGTVETLNLSTGITDDSVTHTCAGNLIKRNCNLVSAIAEYRIHVVDGVINFMDDLAYPKIISKANNTALTRSSIKDNNLKLEHIWVKSTLGGIAFAANLVFNTRQGLIPSSSSADNPDLVDQITLFQYQHMTNYKRWDNVEDCAPAWNDPFDSILAAMNNMMFRTGVHVAQTYNETHLQSMMDDGLKVNYNTTGTVISPVNVFESNFHWFAAAASVQLFSILVVLFTFYGFWRLGRNTSFSPLEIAKAFDAPLLANSPSNSSGNRLARLEGTIKVQYGACNDKFERNSETEGQDSEKLIIAGPEQVHRPGDRR